MENGEIMLNREQKAQVDEFLIEKETLRGKVDRNTKERSKLKELLEKETDPVIRIQIRDSIVFGQDLIKLHNLQAKRLSIRRISDRMGVPFAAVQYYERSSYIPRL